jgi:CHAD domain-containing protein
VEEEDPGSIDVQDYCRTQIDRATSLLRGEDGAPPDQTAIHEIRLTLKRLRATLRLLRDQIGEETFAREDATVRNMGKQLAGTRDADVMLNTLDLLQNDGADAISASSLDACRSVLLKQRRAAAGAAGDPAIREQLIDNLTELRGHVAAWPLRERGDARSLETGLRRIYRQGRRRYKLARLGTRNRGLALHMWRKRVKDLHYATELLAQFFPAGVSRQTHLLGDLLGEEHDLAVLAAWLQTHSDDANGSGPGTKALLTVITRRRRKLAKKALRRGAGVYRRRPKVFARRLRRRR